MSLSTLIADRATAGARYTAAVIELKAAAIDLAAFDICRFNAKFGGQHRAGIGFPDGGGPTRLPLTLTHAEFAPEMSYRDWEAAIQSAARTYLQTY